MTIILNKETGKEIYVNKGAFSEWGEHIFPS